jgi:hypothetical protein
MYTDRDCQCDDKDVLIVKSTVYFPLKEAFIYMICVVYFLGNTPLFFQMQGTNATWCTGVILCLREYTPAHTHLTKCKV